MSRALGLTSSLQGLPSLSPACLSKLTVPSCLEKRSPLQNGHRHASAHPCPLHCPRFQGPFFRQTAVLGATAPAPSTPSWAAKHQPGPNCSSQLSFSREVFPRLRWLRAFPTELHWLTPDTLTAFPSGAEGTTGSEVEKCSLRGHNKSLGPTDVKEHAQF